uniref:Uncharacterized protein n=1 Tax=Glossina pallidipes TaxID=7398 RepID=A0A1B0AJ37_GLOPL
MSSKWVNENDNNISKINTKIFPSCVNEDDNNIEETMDNDYEEHQSDKNEEDICHCDDKDGGEVGSDTDDDASTAGSVTNTKSFDLNRSNWINKAWPKFYNTMKDAILNVVGAEPDDNLIVQSDPDDDDMITDEDDSNVRSTTLDWINKSWPKFYNPLKDAILDVVGAESDDNLIVQSDPDDDDMITEEDDSNVKSTTLDWINKAWPKFYNPLKDAILDVVGAESNDSLIIKSDTDDAAIIANEKDSNVRSTTSSVTNTKLSHSNWNDCTNEACKNYCKSVKEVILKYRNMSMQEKLKIEENAKFLYEKMRSEEDRNIDWCDLTLQQKMPILWTSLCEENLSDDPIDNFKQFYVRNAPRSTNTSMRELQEKSLIVWETMDTKQRLPFKVQAFISKVVKGEANIEDTDDLRRFLEITQ